MFGSLIRRKPAISLDQDDIAFEFDHLFAVDGGSAAVGAARRRPPAVDAVHRQADRPSGGEQLIRVRNMSAGGLMAEVGQMVGVGDDVDDRTSTAARSRPR